MLCIRGTSHGPVSVRLSVTSRSSTETDELIELGFGMWASFHPSYTVLKGNSVISKNKGTSLWNFVLNSWLRKFRHGISIVETCYQLSSRKVDAQSMINWAVVGQLIQRFSNFFDHGPQFSSGVVGGPPHLLNKIYCKILKFLSTLLFTNKPTSSIIYKLLWIEWKANNVSVMDVLASLCTDCQFLA